MKPITAFYLDDDESLERIVSLAMKKKENCLDIIFFSRLEDFSKAIVLGQPDIVILDWFMPELSGLEVFKRLMPYRDLKFIFVSASEKLDHDLLNDRKVLGVIKKPIRPKSFSDEILELWRI